jgi:hypothetical protein
MLCESAIYFMLPVISGMAFMLTGRLMDAAEVGHGDIKEFVALRGLRNAWQGKAFWREGLTGQRRPADRPIVFAP